MADRQDYIRTAAALRKGAEHAASANSKRRDSFIALSDYIIEQVALSLEQQHNEATLRGEGGIYAYYFERAVFLSAAGHSSSMRAIARLDEELGTRS